MAKLSTTVKSKPIALSVKGVFIRNLPAKVIDQKFGNIQEQLEEDQEKLIVSIFTDLICDSKGQTFEDCDTFDAITGALSVTDIQAIIQAIPEAISPNPVSTGK
tara:strand:- start:1779 stop:2090 length:312 start_codon:yes stop_codon:yes gene_type:complete